MARIDKVAQVVRAPAGTALTGMKPVALNAGGSVVLSGTSDCIGVVVIPGTISAGGMCSVLTHGEVVEAGLVAGQIYYGGPAGTITTTSTSANKIGFTVEASRLVVDM
jgi:hypothetical protein